MPRRRIDVFKTIRALQGAAPREASLYLQQLPCSWGSLFFPKPWLEFHSYMAQRLAEAAPLVTIPHSASNGWSTSWKKFMIELAYLRGYLFVYPSLRNQSSFSTNHLEAGEHINGKKNTLKHLPIDFTVPLVAERKMVAALWRGDGGALRPPPPLGALPVLDLFSEPSSQDALIAQGSAAITARSQVADGGGGGGGGGGAGGDGGGGLLRWLGMA